jgi:hypothetical protein
MVIKNNQFKFNISLSILNHLGRNLYRNFITVLGEAISNSWDADAENVWIFIDKDKSSLVIKDDGLGMTSDDFQEKFLKIGYSKRKDGNKSKNRKRPYIGRKGIGKLALLSCARKIHVLSKTADTEYIGGVIDNSDLEEAIKNDLTPDEYKLDGLDKSIFKEYINDHEHGTIIFFENIVDGIKNTPDYLRQQVALYFRFALFSKDFQIFINDIKISINDLDFLTKKTEFVWTFNNKNDPFVISNLSLVKENVNLESKIDYTGFIASVETPRNLKIPNTDEKIGVDLFVNGRLREKDILRHIPRASLVETYLYGQIIYDELDDDADRFTSGREGIVADDPKFTALLADLKEKMAEILDKWDEWRLKHKKDGDPDNKRLLPKERRSIELFNEVAIDYTLPKELEQSKQVESWVEQLSHEAKFNFPSYAECFISENLLRKYICERKIPLTPEAEKVCSEIKEKEKVSKNKGNISIEIRQLNSDLSYLSMDELANLLDKVRDPITEAGLSRDAKEYKPIRDAMAHTALLTDPAKLKLTSVYNNIKARIQKLLSKN